MYYSRSQIVLSQLPVCMAFSMGQLGHCWCGSPMSAAGAASTTTQAVVPSFILFRWQSLAYVHSTQGVPHQLGASLGRYHHSTLKVLLQWCRSCKRATESAGQFPSVRAVLWIHGKTGRLSYPGPTPVTHGCDCALRHRSSRRHALSCTPSQCPDHPGFIQTQVPVWIVLAQWWMRLRL